MFSLRDQYSGSVLDKITEANLKNVPEERLV